MKLLAASADSAGVIAEAADRKKFLRVLRDKCSTMMLELNLPEVEVDGLLLRVIVEDSPVVDEGGAAKLIQWALTNEIAGGLLSFRVNAKAWRTLIEKGVEVPGVSTVHRAKLEVLNGRVMC